MKKIIEYKVVRKYVHEIEITIKEMMREGWELYGTWAVDPQTGMANQPMVKYEQEVDPFAGAI